MVSMIEIALEAKKRFREAVYPPRNLYGWCQAYVTWCVRSAYNDYGAAATYTNADAANDNSQKFTGDVNDAAIRDGDVLYWHGMTDGHVAVACGRDGGRVLVVHTGTRRADVVENLGDGLLISHADTMGYPFSGASHANGTSPAIGPILRPDPAAENKTTEGDDEMSKPMIAMKLDGGPMNTLGVMIDPDGQVTALDKGQWEFWRDRVKCVPVECENPGHWEYLMGVMADRRKRAGVEVSERSLQRIAEVVRESVSGGSGLTVAEIAASLQITPR